MPLAGRSASNQSANKTNTYKTSQRARHSWAPTSSRRPPLRRPSQGGRRGSSRSRRGDVGRQCQATALLLERKVGSGLPGARSPDRIGGFPTRYILIYPQGCDVCNHLSLFLCVAKHGWSHLAQFTIAVINKDPKKSKYSVELGTTLKCHSLQAYLMA
ncbi:hypothetical protein GUJ93_ZPchr0009g2372 [Zizania palustris]|uniref:Uncharacterized protein n=1 Tax=Zizania palustris TaxID=103762 RepID=A0A8J5V2T3_ZIZPA|nr:hypothetical protein GUJ93_ZPchr0009g2372 [Zizania palustris]